MRRRRIRTLGALYQLAQERKAVVCPNTHCYRNRIPAAFMINLQGAVLFPLFCSGMYEYIPKKKEK